LFSAAITQANALHFTCGVAAIFSCHTFCVVFSNQYSPLPFALVCMFLKAKSKIQSAVPSHKKQTKRRSLQPPPPFPYARKKMTEAK